jgi:hypothetical protein
MGGGDVIARALDAGLIFIPRRYFRSTRRRTGYRREDQQS